MRGVDAKHGEREVRRGAWRPEEVGEVEAAWDRRAIIGASASASRTQSLSEDDTPRKSVVRPCADARARVAHTARGVALSRRQSLMALTTWAQGPARRRRHNPRSSSAATQELL